MYSYEYEVPGTVRSEANIEHVRYQYSYLKGRRTLKGLLFKAMTYLVFPTNDYGIGWSWSIFIETTK
jgi:hypothetical protein